MRSRAFVIVVIVLVVLFAVLQVTGRILFRERLPGDRSAFTQTEVIKAKTPSSGGRGLVVFFHGYTGRPMTDVMATVQSVYPDADLLAPQYSSSPLTNEDPLNIVREYLLAIDAATRAVPYDHITLV